MRNIPNRAALALVLAVILCPLMVIADHDDNIQYQSSGEIDPNSSTYLYAGSVMFDPADAKFKYWGCGGVAGDYVILKEASDLEDLDTAPWQHALTPTAQLGDFDGFQVCDPSVVEHDGLLYLHYSGINFPTELDHVTKMGVAVSYNRGRTFERLFSGQPIKEPTHGNLYGAGQSSVVRGPDGLFYMLYSDTSDSSPTENWIRFMRSPVPSFPINLQEEIVSYPAYMFGGTSLELAYNRGRGQFEVIVNGVSDVTVRVVHMDRDFDIVGQTTYEADPGFEFGEGIATITNPLGEIIPFVSSGVNEVTFVASTVGEPRGDFAPWITGPVKYARFTEGPNGVLTQFSGEWDESFSGDLDGDGQDDIIVLNPITYTWKYKLSGQGFSPVHTAQWGLGGDIPIIVNDWDKDGSDEIAVYRPSEGKWYIRYSSTSSTIVEWGSSGDRVFSGDTDGDGDGELIVWRPSTGDWHILYAGSWPSVVSSTVQFGLTGDKTFLHDVDDDGHDDFVVWRVGNSQEYVHYN